MPQDTVTEQRQQDGTSCVLCQRLGVGRVVHDRPQEPDQLARDGHDGDLRRARGAQSVKHFVRAMLRFPGMRDDARILALLPPFERDADLRREPITPRRLHEHVPHMTVARLRDRATAGASTGVSASWAIR